MVERKKNEVIKDFNVCLITVNGVSVVSKRAASECVRVAGGTVPAVLPHVWQGGSNGAGGWEVLRGTNRCTLGELFLHLLRYYAEFPWDKMAVSVRLGRPVAVAECRCARAHKNDPHQWKLLCVEEPFDLTNTARSVYDPDEFERIVRTFRLAHQRLAASRRLADAWPQPPSAPAPLR